MKYYLMSFIFIIILNNEAFSQGFTKISIVKADKMSYDKKLGKNIQRLIGDVVFKHDNTLLYCDSAYFDNGKNSLTAYSNIHINNNDSMHIYGDTLYYNGKTSKSEVINNVRLLDQGMILTTNYLNYNLKTKSGNYINGGRIVDGDNILTSKQGTYFGNSNIVHFKKNVVLENPEYLMKSDTLHYNYHRKISYFYGPTTITSDSNLIYCEQGWYNTVTNISQYKKNAYLISENQKLSGDSIYYDRNKSFGKAYQNVTIIDTVENIILKGNFANYYEGIGRSFITDSALAIIIDEKKDSLFLHSDSLIFNFNEDKKINYLFSHFNVRFYKTDMQGKCDSLVYSFKDSVLEMFKDPVIWSDRNQLSGDYIKMKLDSNNNMDSLFVISNSFIISNDSLNYYNQLKGLKMVGKFNDNKLSKLAVTNSAESIFFVRNEEDELIGMNKSSSDKIEIRLKENKISIIKLLTGANSMIQPIEKTNESQRKLKGYNNLESIRPKDPLDIF